MRPSSLPPRQASDVPLVLGGHTFITQLGSDPLPSHEEQMEIVATCLDNGITWLDTTYQPERYALGRVLKELGRRPEATVFAWNFFRDFLPSDSVGDPSPYQPHHIEVILEQLDMSYVDVLILELNGEDLAETERQCELLLRWKASGYVRALGAWDPNDAVLRHDEFEVAVNRYHIIHREAAPGFAECKKRGLQTIATSPFIRGWELARMTDIAVDKGFGEEEAIRARIADHMLRFTLFQGDVDRVSVAMRKKQWIEANIASVKRGPLTDAERRWLANLQRIALWRHRWQRVRRKLWGG
jgi:aryl-alcohol dehydrogenase-like predicted oxidoreductase